jgi:transposase InsO family protein
MNLHSLARTCPRSRELLVSRVRGGETIAAAAEAAGLSERRAYEWLRRASLAEGFGDRSSRPLSSPMKTPADWEAVIVWLRREKQSGPQIAAKLKLPTSTVGRVLRRHGLGKRSALEERPPVVRYEYRRPGQLVHLDVKKLGRFERAGHRALGRTEGARSRRIGWDFIHVCVDDCSRLAYVEILDDETGETTAAFLRRAARWFLRRGIRIKRVMSDNGSGYRSRAFAAVIKSLRTRHIKTRPYTPRTNGKAERFIQTLLREWAYAAIYANHGERARHLPIWLRFYNRSRPHSALRGQTPMARVRAAS